MDRAYRFNPNQNDEIRKRDMSRKHDGNLNKGTYLIITGRTIFYRLSLTVFITVLYESYEMNKKNK